MQMPCLQQEVIKIKRGDVEPELLPELHPRVAHFGEGGVVCTKIGPEVGRDGLEGDGGGEDGCLRVVVSVGMRAVGFEGLAFEPGYGACFEIFVGAVLERVTDEGQADQVVRVGAQDGGCEVVCMTPETGGGCVCGDE